MRIIAFVSTKGGVGKSTLAECLAVHAAKEGLSVYILDLDPQQSTAAWWRRRKGPDNPLLVTGVESVSRAVKGIKGKKAERDVMIVDTPGSFMGVIADAVTEADAIVIVTQPSAKDLEAQGAIEGLIAKMDRVADTLYCVNRADQRSILTKQALDIVSGKSVKPPVIVMDRADYVKADAAGKIAPEINKAAEPEIAALWQAVKGNRHE